MRAELWGHWLNRIWANRPCWICEASGPCGHREPSVERAYFDAVLSAAVFTRAGATIQ